MRKVSLEQISYNNKGSYGIPAPAIDKESVNDISYLRITDISDDGIIPSKLPKTIDVHKNKNYENYFVNKNDLLIARTGYLGRNYFCNINNPKMVYGGYLIKFSIIKTEELIPLYVKYFFQSEICKKQILSLSGRGSAIDGINEKLMRQIKIPLPDLSTQQYIIDIIGMLSKILLSLLPK
ncbi:restriction endonuclease subunit S [Mycoplasmopsis caviae]|uniref:EcoKI restriction-modification system protein HsdS n=1 Tax=Mycoplasmopsis caviae TaxID=55603 RepID=A0A3P8KBX8_9BACT|nr:restriction endonuclease subunit S [Mycoplasmopsis caviae]UUD35071.1 restriction endonuclease subunit S [Mycoplasmopsis caviae]VDR42104.1 EcoKI restriction-modification system protein HsdS [Mycoplasmopsis caviae]